MQDGMTNFDSRAENLSGMRKSGISCNSGTSLFDITLFLPHNLSLPSQIGISLSLGPIHTFIGKFVIKWPDLEPRVLEVDAGGTNAGLRGQTALSVHPVS